MPIAENIRKTLAHIAAAAQAAGRMPDEVHLLAVSKKQPVAAIQAAYDAGQRDFGENYPQELRDKQPLLPADIRWHQIGHLQTNKVKYIAPFVHLIHSIDSEKLLDEVNKQAAKHARSIECLLQIHISDEDTKSGMDAQTAATLLAHADSFAHIRVVGLMGMAALSDDTALILRQFTQLKQLYDRLNTAAHPLHTLSMGMSSDMQLAIAAGASMVRVGSAIFGERA
jgi:pyridoxal phosphate enzyme (YggS family)